MSICLFLGEILSAVKQRLLRNFALLHTNFFRYPESYPTDIFPTDFSPMHFSLTDSSPETFPNGHFPDGQFSE